MHSINLHSTLTLTNGRLTVKSLGSNFHCPIKKKHYRSRSGNQPLVMSLGALCDHLMATLLLSSLKCVKRFSGRAATFDWFKLSFFFLQEAVNSGLHHAASNYAFVQGLLQGSPGWERTFLQNGEPKKKKADWKWPEGGSKCSDLNADCCLTSQRDAKLT